MLVGFLDGYPTAGVGKHPFLPTLWFVLGVMSNEKDDFTFGCGHFGYPYQWR